MRPFESVIHAAPAAVALLLAAPVTAVAAQAQVASSARQAPDGGDIAATPAGRADAESEMCLAMAIYYESGFEERRGKEAVAQVVLNRLRHPRFPKTVCGVVWEGSERKTGCQFTFTCDGSTARRPAARNWEESLDVARKALAGLSDPQLSGVLNYHADYVTPYWARTLQRVTQIGRHIFYRRGFGAAPQPAAIVAGYGQAPTPPARPAGPSLWGIDLNAASRTLAIPSPAP